MAGSGFPQISGFSGQNLIRDLDGQSGLRGNSYTMEDEGLIQRLRYRNS